MIKLQRLVLEVFFLYWTVTADSLQRVTFDPIEKYEFGYTYVIS